MTKVLIAEDDAVIRAMIARAIERRGLGVHLAEDGAEAVEVFREHMADIALVVLDVRMPKLEGPAALAQMRALCPNVPAILLSGFARNGQEIAELLRDGVRFVPKPIRASALADMIVELVAEVRPPTPSDGERFG